MTAYNIKEIRQLYNLTQEEFATALGITRELVNKMEKGKCRVSKATALLIEKFKADRKSEDFSQDVTVLGNAASDPEPVTIPYYVQRQEQKIKEEAFMVPLVGIKAQAGYIKGYEQVDFIDTLEKYSLPPGVVKGGAQWSYFEVEGDSMEPTFSDGDVLLTSMIHTEDWHDIKDFNVYVILTVDSLIVKRVFKKSKYEWVLISDNEELYAQRILPVANIKEVWTFRRHIKAKAPAPKEFKIAV